MTETGALLPLTTDLRTIMYLSDKVEDRFQKQERARQQQQQFR